MRHLRSDHRQIPYSLEPQALYIHIPFCKSRCFYCDFYSNAGVGDEIKSAYISRLIEHLKCGSAYDIQKVKTVYIGGGTPTSVATFDLERLLSHIDNSFPSISEFTIEGCPDEDTFNLLPLLESLGVNRLSLGAQSFHDTYRKKVGRRGGGVETLSLLRRVSDLWKGRLSVDLLYGFPDQTMEDLHRDLRKILSVGCGHISVYQLTAEDGTPYFERIKEGAYTSLPDEMMDEFWVAISSILSYEGYRRYEISNFCRDGEESLHNATYWKPAGYWGCGAGGVGMRLLEDGSAVRYYNPCSLDDYLNKENFGVITERISRDESMKEHFMLSLRASAGCDCAYFMHRFGCAIKECIPESLENLIDEGLLSLNNLTLKATNCGMDLLNRSLLAIFDELSRNSSDAGRRRVR